MTANAIWVVSAKGMDIVKFLVKHQLASDSLWATNPLLLYFMEKIPGTETLFLAVYSNRMLLQLNLPPCIRNTNKTLDACMHRLNS